ncbi:hypothetical protein FSP39_006230 [Pinctada imbricata]|uniref:SEFIR domain-containing protein n=1 Tax=Pinctada imbricata TaxID=66713 RepID=A0AA88YHG5_PINIB|nr:hypothetical protein FSP39_006230 [Pinctada imbricata]
MARSFRFPCYELKFVPHEAREKLARVFDSPSVTGISWKNLAEKLDSYYNHRLEFTCDMFSQIEIMPCSPTQSILREAEKRRVTTDQLQRAIEELGATGDKILPECLNAYIVFTVIKAKYEASIGETGTPGPSHCMCQDCLSQSISYQVPSYPSDATIRASVPYHPDIRPQYDVPRAGLHPTNDGTSSHGGCNDTRCAHTTRVVDMSTQRRRQRQISNEDNNCQSLQNSQTVYNNLHDRMSSLPSQSNNNTWSLPSPGSYPHQHTAAQAYPYTHCDCRHCEQRRLSSDWEETERKSSTSSNEQTTSNNWSSGSTQTTDPSQATNQNQSFRYRSNSDGLSSASDTSRGGSKRSGGSDSDITRIHPQCTCTHFTQIPVRRKKYGVIFVSLAEHSNTHIREVVTLCQCLQEIGFAIKCDMMDDLFKGQDLNCHQWIDTWFNKAKFVLFCISPRYHEYISVGTEEETRNQRETAEPNNNRFHTRYIFDRARSEFINNNSLNYRFIPVVFRNSGATTKDGPEFLQSTLWYTYPDGWKSLATFLKYRGS